MPAIESANLRAEAEQLRAHGEHKALHPSVDAALQYGVINETLTNYQQFFQPGTFRRNNVTVGLVIRFPILNASQRARAQAADAEALSARKEAENAKGELSSQIARLRNAVRQSSAARDVAQVQYELAQAQLESAQVRIQSQTAPLRELQDASLQAVESSGGLMDSELDAERAQLQLLLATGQLESWSAAAK
jgi:outer membrane protein TolC